MPKTSSVFICQNCGEPHGRWLGKCNSCGKWNTLVEEIVSKNTIKNPDILIKSTPQSLTNISELKTDRLLTNIRELDAVLGGGIVIGSVILIGGDPGIGKSTISLQIAKKVADSGKTVLYVTGEESLHQIQLRAKRLNAVSENILALAETNILKMNQEINKTKPDLIIIDSIQTVYRDEIMSSPGSVSQVRECTAYLTQIAKSKNIPMILIGHVTKEGSIAGPKVLEHMVDTVLYFEGDRHGHFRILRSIKNRYGSTNEIGIFEMGESGLKEVLNPSEIFLNERPKDQSGTAVIATLEGSRPLLIEIQALVSNSNVGFSRRTYTGVDNRRADILIAVLEKKAGLILSSQDIYLNVAGGLKVFEPAADLGIALAIASSFKNEPLSSAYAIVGELGLTGEVRAVSQFEQRISEINKLGLTKCIAPIGNKKGLGAKNLGDLEIEFVGNIQEALEILS